MCLKQNRAIISINIFDINLSIERVKDYFNQWLKFQTKIWSSNHNDQIQKGV